MSRGGIKSSSLSIQGIHKHSINPKICGRCEVVLSIEIDRVGMRLVLAASIHAATQMLHQIGASSQRSVGFEIEHGDIATIVICHQKMAARRVDNQVTWRRAPRRELIEHFKLPLPVEPIGTDGATRSALIFVHFIHRVEKRSRGVKGQERGIFRFDYKPHRSHLTGVVVEKKAVDTLTRASGVCSDENVVGGSPYL